MALKALKRPYQQRRAASSASIAARIVGVAADKADVFSFLPSSASMSSNIPPMSPPASSSSSISSWICRGGPAGATSRPLAWR